MTKELQVCIVVLELSVGGLEWAVVKLANYLQAQRIPTRIIVIERNEYNTLLTEVDAKVEVFCLSSKLWKKLFQLRALTKDHVIHLQFWGGHLKPLYRIALLGRRPLIVTYSNVYTYARSQLLTAIDRVMSLQVSAIVAKSETVKEYCTQKVRIPPAKVTVIYNGVDVVEGKRSQHAIRDRLELVCIARLVKQKDHKTLFNAIAIARKGGCNLHLTIIGDGSEVCSLIQLATQLNIRDMLTWMGELSARRIINEILRGADVFVTTSLWEGFPNAILEAMANGMPIVASDIEPHREALGSCAMYFAPGDANALAQIIERLYRDYGLAHELGRAAHNRVQVFSMEKNGRKHIDLYNTCLNRAKLMN